MASSSSSTANTVIVVSDDGEEFEMPINAAKQSTLIKSMIDEGVDVSNKVPLCNVSSATLVQVIKYCNKHAEHAENDELKKWDVEFLGGQKCDRLFYIVLAANYLEIPKLLDSSCQFIADMIKDKSVDEVRKFFNLKNDYTSKELSDLCKEYAWAFDI